YAHGQRSRQDGQEHAALEPDDFVDGQGRHQHRQVRPELRPDRRLTMRLTIDAVRLTNLVLPIAFAAILAAGVSPASAQTDVRLVIALKSQNVAAARALIKQRADVNAPDVDGSTAL